MIYKTDIDSIKANIKERHQELMQTDKRYHSIDNELRWIDLTVSVQAFYYDEVGVSSNDLWKRIDIAAGEFLDLEEFLYNR